jgi:hypothetical protein
MIFCSGRAGTASLSPYEKGEDLRPLFDTILEYMPAPEGDETGELQLLVSSIDYNDYVGRIGIGRIERGVIKQNQEALICNYHEGGAPKRTRIVSISQFDGLGRSNVESATVGDIVCFSGCEDISIGDTVCSPVKAEPLEIGEEKVTLEPKRTVIYLVLFALSIAIVFRGIPYWIGLIVIPLVLLFMDRRALGQVDYPLLLTFVFFFIFSGNMARIEVVREAFSWLLDKNTLVVSTMSCQAISNVPSAILLSQFTDNYAPLLVGVNIGGAGTLIASLASLITFREYVKHEPGKTGSYVLKFSLFNFGMLGILLAAMMIIM